MSQQQGNATQPSMLGRKGCSTGSATMVARVRGRTVGPILPKNAPPKKSAQKRRALKATVPRPLGTRRIIT
eukprot:9731771-Prorocentrum_lima.AAC.1